MKNQNRCVTPVTVTFFGHSDKGKLEKRILQSTENKNKNPLSLLNTDVNNENDNSNSNYNSLDKKALKSPKETKSPNSKSTNLFFAKDAKLSSNPFLNFTTENQVNTNPFHDSSSNPFLSNNPFRDEEVDGKKTEDGQTPVDNGSINNQVRLFQLTWGYLFALV